MAAFIKGQSGNPNGRPKGAKGFRARFFERLAEKNQDKIEAGVNWLFELVDNKDFNALKLMLDFFGCKARNDDGEPEAENEKTNVKLSSEDLKVLAAILEGKKGNKEGCNNGS